VLLSLWIPIMDMLIHRLDNSRASAVQHAEAVGRIIDGL
jgi:hypothetical protein